MSESSEGLRGLWNRISGKKAPLPSHKRPVQTPEEIEVQAQQIAQRTSLAKDRAAAFRRQLEAALSVEEVTLEAGTINYESEIANIEQQVTAREIYGKFHPGVTLKGQEFVKTESPDFTEYGNIESIPFGLMSMDKTPYLIALSVLKSVLREGVDNSSPQLLHDLRKKHFLTRVSVPNSEDEIVSYSFLQDHRDTFRRPSGMAVFNFRLPGQSAARLFALVRQNPEAAEMFLQKGAEGFEADPQTQKLGVGRIRSDEIVLVNLGKFNLNYFNPYIYPYTGAPLAERMSGGNLIIVVKPMISSDLVENQNGQIERLRYSQQHGVVAPETIP